MKNVTGQMIAKASGGRQLFAGLSLAWTGHAIWKSDTLQNPD